MASILQKKRRELAGRALRADIHGPELRMGMIKIVLLGIVLIYANFYIQTFWAGPAGSGKVVRAVNVMAIEGEQINVDMFIDAPYQAPNSFAKIYTSFVSMPDTSVPGEKAVYILACNLLGYVNLAKSKLTVVEGSTKVFAETEPGADDITVGDFVYRSGVPAKLAFVQDEPVFDPVACRYTYDCVVSLAGRDIPCELYAVDKTPPEITGVRNIESVLGNPIIYMDGVAVKDKYDRNVKLRIETNAVATKIGSYLVTYRAADESGNEAVVNSRVRVISADEAWVAKKVDSVLAGILREGMSRSEQARAIYKWIRTNIKYNATPRMNDVVLGAHWALSHGSGDCYTFYAVSELLLTRAGIPNMHIQRTPGSDVDHHWNLVNIDGDWYHFDATPPFEPFDGCLFTDSEASEYAELQSPYRSNYYDYIKDDYPPVIL